MYYDCFSVFFSFCIPTTVEVNGDVDEMGRQRIGSKGDR